MSESPTADSPRPSRAKKILVRGGLAFVLILGLAVGGARLRYGGGEYYQDLSGEPRLPESAIETVVTSTKPIGNVAVARDGRIFFTIHPEAHPSGAKLYVAELNGEPKPFPAEDKQAALLDTPLGCVIDSKDRLWTIDHGNNGTGTARILAFDINSGAVVHDYKFAPEIAPLGSMLQDLQIDADKERAYIADVAFWRKAPGLVTYDIKNQKARRVLNKHVSVFPKDIIVRSPRKDLIFFGGVAAMKLGVDGIALSRDKTTIYYGAMAHDTLYSIPADALFDEKLDDAALAGKIKTVGKKPLNDGLSCDDQGHILVTDVEHGAVLSMSPDGKLETLVKSPKIRWADALSFGPDGWLYIADSALDQLVLQSQSHIKSQAPFYIHRFKPGTTGAPGH